MNRPTRKNALIVAFIAAAATIVAALISSGFWKKEPAAAPTAVQQRIENKAETSGSQSPAVAGAKDVVVTYGEKKGETKPKP